MRPKTALRDMPDWPRLLNRDAAAAYVGLSLNAFEARVGDTFPAPIRIGGRKVYDRRALDRAVDRIANREPQSVLTTNMEVESWRL